MNGYLQRKRHRKEALTVDDPLELIVMGFGRDELGPEATEGVVSIELESPALKSGTIMLTPIEAVDLAKQLQCMARAASRAG